MTELQTKQLQLLNDTIAHFNSTNRAHQYGRCQYAPIEGISVGCAIGRLIEDKKLCAKFDKGMSKTVNGIFGQLPKELQQYQKDFLNDLQSLHDDENNWESTGLTEQGFEEVVYIKKKFGLE